MDLQAVPQLVSRGPYSAKTSPRGSCTTQNKVSKSLNTLYYQTTCISQGMMHSFARHSSSRALLPTLSLSLELAAYRYPFHIDGVELSCLEVDRCLVREELALHNPRRMCSGVFRCGCHLLPARLAQHGTRSVSTSFMQAPVAQPVNVYIAARSRECGSMRGLLPGLQMA